MVDPKEYAGLFSRRALLDAVLLGDFGLLHRLARRDREEWPDLQTYREWYGAAYKYLQERYACEYVVKNELVTHGLADIGLLPGAGEVRAISELRLGDAIADLAVFRGDRMVGLEVKTELDSPARLVRQLPWYLGLFHSTYLVVPETRVDRYRTYLMDGRVGLITYGEGVKDFRAVESPGGDVDPISVRTAMEVLHQAEFRDIVLTRCGAESLNGVSQVALFSRCKELLGTVDGGTLRGDIAERVGLRGVSLEGMDGIFGQAVVALRGEHVTKGQIEDVMKSNIILER